MQNPCLLEPYRNGITLDGINDCLSKRFAIREIFHREAKLVLRQLQRRFGEIPQNLQENIRNLPVERLEDLGLALLDFNTLTDLDNWLHP